MEDKFCLTIKCMGQVRPEFLRIRARLSDNDVHSIGFYRCYPHIFLQYMFF